MDIVKAEPDDIKQLLAVQKLAYQQQAELTNDYLIPPLTETPKDLKRDITSLVFLKMIDDSGRIIGSVRGRPEDGTCFIGRLFIHPDYQGRGLGTRLLAEMEAMCPEARYELFTSDKSVDNIRLYEKLGYVVYKETDHPAGYKLVYMEKRIK